MTSTLTQTTDTTPAADEQVDHEARERAEYIAGLRALADALEQHPELELPYDGHGTGLTVMAHGDQRAVFAAWAGILPGRKDKSEFGRGGQYFQLDGSLRGLKIRVLGDRDQVCERVVVATREVTEEVPDPEALAAVPKVTLTRVEEEVEWRCSSLLAPATSGEVLPAGDYAGAAA